MSGQIEEYKPKRGRPKLTEEEKRRREVQRAEEKRLIKEKVKFEIAKKQEEEDISAQIKSARRFDSLPDINTSNPAQVKKRIQEFFKICTEENELPSYKGLAIALGVDSGTLKEWLEKGEKGSEITNVLARAIDMITNVIEQLTIKGKIPVAFARFLLMANFGYKENAEMNVTTKDDANDAAKVAKLQEKYKNSIVDDFDIDSLLTAAKEPPKGDFEE